MKTKIKLVALILGLGIGTIVFINKSQADDNWRKSPCPNGGIGYTCQQLAYPLPCAQGSWDCVWD